RRRGSFPRPCASFVCPEVMPAAYRRAIRAGAEENAQAPAGVGPRRARSGHEWTRMITNTEVGVGGLLLEASNHPAWDKLDERRGRTPSRVRNIRVHSCSFVAPFVPFVFKASGSDR